MLPLPTEAAIEAVNVSTDRRHPFHTYKDRNRFIQFGFIQQNIVVDIDDLERDMAISNGKGSLRHWCLGYGQCFSVISISWYNSLIQQHKQAYLFLSYFWSSAIIQTPIWLGRSSKNIYIDEPKSRNHIAIDSLPKSLTFRTKCRNHRIIKKINKWNNAVG